MRGAVYYNGLLAGLLEKTASGAYRFVYDDLYFANNAFPSISLTLYKNTQEFISDHLFAFFYGLLSEGVNKDIQCRLLKIDEADDFTRLLQTTGIDTVGAITIKPIVDVV